jgi:hypothetical protein
LNIQPDFSNIDIEQSKVKQYELTNTCISMVFWWLINLGLDMSHDERGLTQLDTKKKKNQNIGLFL